MDGLTQEQWAAIGPVLNKYAGRLDAILETGTYTNHTAKGFLFHLMTDAGVALSTLRHQQEEDAAWDEHKRREADRASEDAYDEYCQVTHDGEIPEAWRDDHMLREN